MNFHAQTTLAVNFADHLDDLLDEVRDEDPTRNVRRSLRYPLRAPVTFTWRGLDGVEHRGKGISRDISEGGAYVVTRTCPPLRSSITLVIRFASLPGLAPSYRLELAGRVVRIEPLLHAMSHSKESWGFAVSSSLPVLREGDGLDDPESTH